MGEKLSKMSMFIHGEILDPETTSETWLLSFDRVVFASFIRKNGSNFSYSAPLLMEYYRWRNRVAFNRINARLNAHIYRYYLRVSFFKISQSRFPPLNNFRF